MSRTRELCALADENAQGQSNGDIAGLSRHQITASLPLPMSLSHFLRIERDAKAGAKHYVVHTTDPQFSMELIPDRDAPDKMGRGVLKRLSVPNSWAGDYTKYDKLMSAAQEFFAQSSTEADHRPGASSRFPR